MISIVTSKERLKDIANIKRKRIFDQGFIICFVIALGILSTQNYLLFHSTSELFSSIIALFVFLMCINTYDISNNNYFLVLSSGYFWVAILDLLHIIVFPGVGILSYTSSDIPTQFWILARYIESFTMLISVVLVNKPMKRLNFGIVFGVYSLISVFLILSIYYFRIFPQCFTGRNTLTNFKVYSEIIISCIFFVTAILCYKMRKGQKDTRLKYIMISCFISVISELFFSIYISVSHWLSATGHILKAVACYYMYKGIVEVGLKRPYLSMDNNLRSKNMELQFINEMLTVESSKRKGVEEILISNEKCYEMLVKYSRDAILVHRNDKYVFANDGAAQLFEVNDSDDLIGMAVSDFTPTETRDLAGHRIREIYNKKCSMPFAQMKLLQASGEVRDVEAGSSYFAYKGEPSILTIIRDIGHIKEVKSLKKDIEVTKEYNRVLMEFFSNISHELKTPLNVILGAIQILGLPSKSKLPDEFEAKLSRYLKTMKQNCYRLLRLVNNLIDQSKLDSGYLKLNLKNLDIVSVVENITLSVADYAYDKGIEVIFDTDTEEKTMAFDADKIERIILNLLSNSIKFISNGGKIIVNLYDKGDAIAISVKDTGIGIPEDKLNLIFDRFGQVDKTLARNKEGSGIGLSLVRSLVDMHNGTITVNSKFGEGSEFIIEFPVYITDIEDKGLENSMYQSSVERISIEFSDIYS
ncbi:MASE3 domain-containing sensor histidine kinase [Clostridium cylindrosporum]|uniref:histidine kinase n=1 Tax=Clostridium cylindrosporum DSM 605 TaxID=1121307 RepID=A0A0J8D8N8_CLOCY|nr:MASE3 domain-containing protein [Clostridium cylindrosporum]KMT22247.1 sensor histidine kinase ResE [Clostridium cylindrosporum DSM 605]